VQFLDSPGDGTDASPGQEGAEEEAELGVGTEKGELVF